MEMYSYMMKRKTRMMGKKRSYCWERFRIETIEWWNLSRSLQNASKIGLIRRHIESVNDLIDWMKKPKYGDWRRVPLSGNGQFRLIDILESDAAHHYSSCFA